MAREVGLIYSIRRERYRLQDWLGRWWMLVALVAVVAFAAGMIAAFVPGTKHLSFKIKGQCVSAPRGGVLYGVGGKNITPPGKYKVTLTMLDSYKQVTPTSAPEALF